VSKFPEINHIPDRYVSLDVGFVDMSFGLFAYYDFLRAKICIQREYVSRSATTDDIARDIKRIEKEIWGSVKPFKRYSDTDLRLIADLRKLYDIKFEKTEKDAKEATINLLRTLVRDGQIEIHESCKNLILQLENGLWKTSSSGKRVFVRNEQLGHLDGIDALLYLIRNVKRNRAPTMPSNFNPHTHFDPWGEMQRKTKHKNLAAIFK
jgi:hypothetical protein